MSSKFITKEELAKFQHSIGMLSNWTGYDEPYYVGPNKNTTNVKETKLLHELAKVNKRRLAIINELTK